MKNITQIEPQTQHRVLDSAPSDSAQSDFVQNGAAHDVAPASQRVDLPILGMHCASCAGRIEKALNKAQGVENSSVNFATTRATVHFNPQLTDAAALREVVQKAGYDAIVAEEKPADEHSNAHSHGDSSAPDDVQSLEAKARADEYQAQKQKFIVALILTIPVAFLVMAGHLVPSLERTLDFPARLWLELFLTIPVLFWAGREFFTGAWTAAQHRAADMNTLVAIGTLSAFLYSLAVTVAPQWFRAMANATSSTRLTGALPNTMPNMNMNAPVGVYYEVAAIVVTLILMGRLLEARAGANRRSDSRLDGFAGQNRARRTRWNRG